MSSGPDGSGSSAMSGEEQTYAFDNALEMQRERLRMLEARFTSQLVVTAWGRRPAIAAR